MPKRKKGKNKSEEDKKKETNTLAVGKYTEKFEKHAFIVSPGRQKIPKGIETKERALWQYLIQNGNNKRKILELIHYVKVTKSDRYSNNNEQIICSPKAPVQLPFLN